MFRALLLVALIVASTNAYSQQPASDISPQMLGFLKVGMHVGVQKVIGSADVYIHVYADGDFATVKHLANTKISEIDVATVAATNPRVQEALDAFLSQSDFPRPSIDRVRVSPSFNTDFGQIVAIGNDYVLVAMDDQGKRRRLLPKTFIASIFLDADPVKFHTIDRQPGTQTGG